jgi:hypothetical protein
MWGTVLLMAVVTAAEPKGIAVVVYMLSRSKPLRLLVPYFIGAFGLNMIIGAIVLFVLKGVGAGKKSSVPPQIEVAVGALALIFGALVASGFAERVRDRARQRRPSATPARSPQGSAPHDSLQDLPGFSKLPARAQAALQSDSPWLAWIIGLGGGLPGAYYLAAIAAILKAGDNAGVQVVALIVFNVIAFAVIEIPIVSYAAAPEATRARFGQLSDWASANQRLLVSLLAAVVGVYLLVVGISKL